MTRTAARRGPAALLQELGELGIRVEADGRDLDLLGPEGSITPEVRTKVASHKAQLLNLLRKVPEAGRPAAAASVPVTSSAPQARTSRLVELRRRVIPASDEELEALLEEANQDLEAGRLNLEEAEDLVRWVGQERKLKAVAVPPPSDAGAAGPAESDPWAAMPVSEALELRGGSLRIRSRLLGAVVVVASDDAEVPAGPEVVYRLSELRHLVGQPPGVVLPVHAAKLELDAEVIA